MFMTTPTRIENVDARFVFVVVELYIPQNKFHAHAFHQTTKMQIDVGEIIGRFVFMGVPGDAVG